MSSRDAILQRIRTSLNVDPADAGRAVTVARRLRSHSAGVLPAPTDPQINEITRFRRKAEASFATVSVVARRNVAKAVQDFLRDHNLPQRLRLGDDKRLQRIAWPQPGGPELLVGPGQNGDPVGLSYAFAAASETGTLFLVSGAANPTTINFLSENHIVLVDARDLEPHYETIWTRIRKAYGETLMPRTVNLITGPSRSADLEQTLILGAHGPVRLHVIVVK
jgi:L-lactate dehydrogenase complex protein LldG